MKSQFGSVVIVGLAVLLSMTLHGCSSGGGVNRSQLEGSGDGVGEGGFVTVGTAYEESAANLHGDAFSLAGSSLTQYTAAVAGGVACFGDLYENGTSKNVTIDVSAGQKLLIRKDAKGCKITYTSLTFGQAVVTSDKGLSYVQNETATFKSTDRTFVQVTVKKGLSSDAATENLKVELQGAYVDADEVETKIENSELYVATSGTAYAAPAVNFNSHTVQYFNDRIYGNVVCSFAPVAGGCKDSNEAAQKIAEMAVWITNAKLDAIATADRFKSLEAMFVADGVIKVSTDRVLTGLQLASSDGSLGVKPAAFKVEDKKAFIVIRMNHGAVNAYKVFLLNK